MNDHGALMPDAARAKVIAVVVTFEPDIPALQRVLTALSAQVAAVVVVDNGSAGGLDTAGLGADHWLLLDRNLGIAAAQNRGIDWARSRGAEFVLLSDQDSEPAPDMVARLVSAAHELAAAGAPLALVAPAYLDARQAVNIPFMHLTQGRPRWFDCDDGADRPEITTAIASGALIPMTALDAVGLMREALFIDLVDVEWCFRARAQGLRAFGVCSARLGHRLGERPARVLGRTLATHSPLRNYYFYRNALWLFRQDYVPAAWKRVIAGQMLKRYLVFSLLVRPQLAYFRMMTLGIWHGLRGRGGPL